MTASTRGPLLLVWSSALVAALFAIYPLPAWLMYARPEWLVLWVIYWVLRAPQHVGMGSAWIAGLLLDGILGGPLGAHALACAVVAYMTLALRSRMLHYTLVQQMGVVCAAIGTGQLLCHWAQGLGGQSTPSMAFLMGSLTSAFCWPIVSMRSGHRGAMEGWDTPA
jgi:rod shape-determining protein MreD